VSTLADRLKRRIAEEGPITVAEYMRVALTDVEGGYYMGRDPFGRGGDFVTAPEISQMFGELIGLWCMSAWLGMGKPARFNLVEMGPGRGTLMKDMLRAAGVDPDFVAALSAYLVEVSPALRRRQEETLAGLKPKFHWVGEIEEVPDGPMIVVANEFFDALPVRQFVMTKIGWLERLVGPGKAGKDFAFAIAATPPSEADKPRAAIKPQIGDVFETRPEAGRIARAIAGRLARHPGYALIVDYGHAQSATGDTLQAVKNHNPHDPLIEPGQADLTALVDFLALKRAAGAAGAQVYGPVEQGPWLESLGIGIRADSLKKANPARAAEIEAAYFRLTAADAMGQLFKALALGSPGLPAPPGFQ
jgi:SAM-dependent MidA family methyltransferase